MNCLLLHGLGQQASAWDKVREHLPEQIHTEQPNLSDFFHEENELQIVYPKEDYFEKEDEHKNSITWLIATAQSRSMEPILVQLQPGQSMPEDKPHEGEEFGYVLDGEIRLHYGEDVYTVRKGDSFIFPANRKHKISSACKKVSSILWISSPPSF